MDTHRLELINESSTASQNLDSEKQSKAPENTKNSVYKSLGWLDRLLVLWILLAIIIGILLGNFVDSVGPALQQGKFANVSSLLVNIALKMHGLD